MDLDEDMISEARRYVSAAQRQHIHLYVGDTVQLPYPDRTLDAVFGFGVLHHLPDWRAGVAEIARVLKPGGTYFLEEFYPAFYLNPVVRRLVTHPEEDRFYSHDLRANLTAQQLPTLQDTLEIKQLGILAICRKSLS